jgi:hypothetical protein
VGSVVMYAHACKVPAEDVRQRMHCPHTINVPPAVVRWRGVAWRAFQQRATSTLTPPRRA